MYIEILNDVVTSYLVEEKPGKGQPITINLTPFIHKTLVLEINDLISYKTTVSISFINIESVVLHDRTIKLVSGEKLDTRFETLMVQKLLAYGINHK